jgi:Zn-dependent peptidase ImmA (M78 family)
MKHHNAESLVRAAHELRTELGIEGQYQPSMIDVLQRLKRLGYIADFVRVSNQKMPHAEVSFDSRERKLFLHESTYSAAIRGDPRARWTIAHEIGHAVLGHRGIHYRKGPSSIDTTIPEMRRHESEAHRFADEFLAPSHLIDFAQVRTAQELAARFGISQQAAQIRFKAIESSSYPVTEKITAPLIAPQIGKKHYDSIRDTLEQNHFGQFVMINVDTAEYVVSETTSQVHAKFVERFGEDAAGWCTRVGASIFVTA